MVSLKRSHEGLLNYISSITTPAGLSVPATRPRLDVAPAGPIPPGLRPIPTSSQKPKTTNAQIPYVRQGVDTVGLAGIQGCPAEGDIVFVQKKVVYSGNNGKPVIPGNPSHALAYGIEQLNALLETPRPNEYDADTFFYCCDGVVNNVDWPDPEHEYKTHRLLNVAVQGHVRLDHSPDRRATCAKPSPASTVFVGLFAVPTPGGGQFTHVLKRFSSCQILSFNHPTNHAASTDREIIDSFFRNLVPGGNLVLAWRVGRVVDTAQSNNMLQIVVGVVPIFPVLHADADPSYQSDGTNPAWVLRRNTDGTPAVFESMVERDVPEAFEQFVWRRR